MNRTDCPFLADLWRRHAGLPPAPATPRLDLADLEASEWCPEFEVLMRNRLLMGAFRYGRMGEPGKPRWDRVPDMARRLELYRRDGNQEHLVDVANLCMLEFVEGDHPLKHLASQDDAGHTVTK